MRLLSIILCIISYLYLVTSDHGFNLVKTSNSHIYDDSMELSSRDDKKSLEKDYDLSKNTKTTDDDFSLGDEKETSINKSGMSLEVSKEGGEDPFNKITQQPIEQENIEKNVLTTLNSLHLTTTQSTIITIKNNSIDGIQKITTADENLFNDETTIKMVNEGLAVLMRTIPTNINNDQEVLITTSSPKVMIDDRNPDIDNKSDMFLDISNENEKIYNKTVRDDVQFDIGDEDIIKDENNKIIIKNNNNDNSINKSNIVDIKKAEDITIPFNVVDKLSTTENPLQLKNFTINDLINDENVTIESDSNSMEVKQSTIFIGPSITTTHLPITNKEDDGGEVFIIDDNKEIFPDTTSSKPINIEEKSSETIAHLSTSLTVSSIEENTTNFPDSSEFTELTSTVIIPRILSTTLESTTKNDNDYDDENKVITKVIQEVDFSQTTESSIFNDISLSNNNTSNDITTSNNFDATTMTLNEILTTHIPEGENMTFDEKAIQNKQNIEGNIERTEKRKDESDDEVILNHESIEISTTTNNTTINTTTNTPIISTTTTSTTTKSPQTSTSNISTTTSVLITSENIAIEVMKSLQNETENKNNNDNMTFADFIFSTPIVNYIVPIAIISSIILFILIIVLIYYTCKKRKENGMLRFTNSQTSSTLSKIEEGVNMEQVKEYNKYNDNVRVSITSLPKDRDVDLVGFGPLDKISKK